MATLVALLIASLASSARAEDDFELPPLNYSNTEPNDEVHRLLQRLNENPELLRSGSDQSFLSHLLRELKVSEDSQVLVFSKTSLQRQRISPETPRALYFSDRCYVGWVPGGDAEVMSFDAALGATFYLVPRESFLQKPTFKRSNECLSCHAGSRTRGVPAPLIRSVFTDERGEPILSAGSFSVTQQNPLSERWGGWYVTGRHGTERHMGNVIARDLPGGPSLDREKGANVLDLDKFFPTDRYLRKSSDIVALMVLEHQIGVQQRLHEANQNVRLAIHRYQALMRDLKEPFEETLGGSARSVVRHHATKLIEEMLSVDEASLTGGGVEGSRSFVDTFQRDAIRDRKGRSLRDLNLRTRLFQYRMSYLIYSPLFDGLPAQLRAEFWTQLWALLNEEVSREPFERLRRDDKQSIKEILAETKAELPAYWKH